MVNGDKRTLAFDINKMKIDNESQREEEGFKKELPYTRNPIPLDVVDGNIFATPYDGLFKNTVNDLFNKQLIIKESNGQTYLITILAHLTRYVNNNFKVKVKFSSGLTRTYVLKDLKTKIIGLPAIEGGSKKKTAIAEKHMYNGRPRTVYKGIRGGRFIYTDASHTKKIYI